MLSAQKKVTKCAHCGSELSEHADLYLSSFSSGITSPAQCHRTLTLDLHLIIDIILRQYRLSVEARFCQDVLLTDALLYDII